MVKCYNLKMFPHKIYLLIFYIIPPKDYSTACVDGKVSVGLSNHIMYLLTISGNSRAGYRVYSMDLQYDCSIMKKFSGGLGV